jgi:UDP-galactopyranose mutase
VVFDKDCSKNKNIIKSYLKEIGLVTHGRFGEWDYFNMDICIKKSIDLAEFIKQNY